jgi:hypothetical protein
MKIETVKLSRKFSLGNYEMLEAGFEASVSEQDNVLETLKVLEDLAETYLQVRTMKGGQKKLEAEPEPELKPELKQLSTEMQALKLQVDDAEAQAKIEQESHGVASGGRFGDIEQAKVEQELLEHQGWKNKRQPDGSYTKGSLNWGWDKAENFSEAAIEFLGKYDLTPVGDYLFGLAGDNKGLVQVKRGK